MRGYFPQLPAGVVVMELEEGLGMSPVVPLEGTWLLCHPAGVQRRASRLPVHILKDSRSVACFLLLQALCFEFLNKPDCHYTEHKT